MAAVLMGLIAFIILPAILIYSLIKPAKLHIRTRKNPIGKWTRGKFLLGWFIVWFISIGIGVSLTPEQEATDLEHIAADAGLSPDEYEMQENGALKIKAPEEPAAVSSDQPLAVQGENWKYVVSNALMVADAHAVANNPSATYLPQNSDISLIEQIGGQYEGEYLLTVVNDNHGDISYVQLRPLFDVNESSDLLEEQLDEETPLWEVTIAKYNGKEF